VIGARHGQTVFSMEAQMTFDSPGPLAGPAPQALVLTTNNNEQWIAARPAPIAAEPICGVRCFSNALDIASV
jgi:hypothetical protein